MFTKEQELRFIKRITKKEDGCWDHTGLNCTINMRRWKVGRVSWIINFGEIPDGMDVKKICKNRKCVNPRHLYLKETTKDKTPLVIRFWNRVKKTDDCWEWLGRKTVEGYGLINENGVQHRANRLSYEIHFGKIEPGMLICHECNNPSCTNPDHLYQGTPKENSQDMILAGNSQKGIKNTNAVLTEKEVLEIRKLYLTKKYSYKGLGVKFDVHEATIGQIIRGDTWTHV